MTHNYVLAEIIPLCQVRGLNREKVLAFIHSILKNPLIEIYWTNEVVFQQAMLLLESRRDKTYSLCDAVSFVVMREQRIQEALTTDRHFVQEGFVSLLGQ